MIVDFLGFDLLYAVLNVCCNIFQLTLLLTQPSGLPLHSLYEISIADH